MQTLQVEKSQGEEATYLLSSIFSLEYEFLPVETRNWWVHLWCQSAREPIDGGDTVFGVETIEIVFSLIRFSLSLQSCMFNCSSSSFRGFVYIKKRGRVSTGFARVPGRPARSIEFRRVNSPPGFYLDPDRSQARVGRVPGRPAGPVQVSKLWPPQPLNNHNIHTNNLIQWQH